MSDADSTLIVFCGCWGGAGHMLHRPGYGRWKGTGEPWGAGPWKHLDTKSLHPQTNHTGDAQVTHLGGWTALGIVDLTVDSRPGSHSTFAIEGTYDFDQALALARRFFPAVIKRIGSVVLDRPVTP